MKYALLLFIVAGTSLFAQPETKLDQAGLRFIPPAEFLGKKQVRVHLNSGLTVTLRIRLAPRSNQNILKETIFRIDIRYEPWDEIYMVSTWQPYAAPNHRTYASMEELSKWWQDPELMVLPVEQVRHLNQSSPTSWQATIEVIPFSHQEQDRARDWLTSAETQVPAESTSQDSTLSESPIVTGNQASVMQLILATSIRREAVYREKWRIRFP